MLSNISQQMQEKVGPAANIDQIQMIKSHLQEIYK